MIDLCRSSILVNTKQADIQIVAWIFEIIWVAAEEGHLLLGSEDQAHIVVTFVPIEMVGAALVKGDHVGTKSSPVFAFLLNRRDDRTARIGSLLVSHSRFR